MTVWPAPDERAGLDLRWDGRAGVRRAAMARDKLISAGHAATMTQDELGWTVRLGPIDRAMIGDIVGRFLALG